MECRLNELAGATAFPRRLAELPSYFQGAARSLPQRAEAEGLRRNTGCTVHGADDPRR